MAIGEHICLPKLLLSLFNCILYNLKGNKYYITSKLTVQSISFLSLYFHNIKVDLRYITSIYKMTNNIVQSLQVETCIYL